MSRFWKATTRWPNDTVFIVGGGPSLKDRDLSGLTRANRRRDQRVMVVNNGFRLLPDADVLFYADTRWWSWNGKDVNADFGGDVISTCSAGVKFLDPRVLRMNRDYHHDPKHLPPEQVYALSMAPDALCGPDSGYMAMNLAFLLGVSRIVLLGFDMGFKNEVAHWHEDHPVKTPESNYTDLFLPRYPALYEALTKQNVEVLRCTPSRLDFIPEVPLSDALAMPARQGGVTFVR